MKINLPKLPQSAAVIGGVVGAASWVVSNQTVMQAIPGNTAKSIVQVASGILGFLGLLATLLGHSIGTGPSLPDNTPKG